MFYETSAYASKVMIIYKLWGVGRSPTKGGAQATRPSRPKQNAPAQQYAAVAGFAP